MFLCTNILQLPIHKNSMQKLRMCSAHRREERCARRRAGGTLSASRTQHPTALSCSLACAHAHALSLCHLAILAVLVAGCGVKLEYLLVQVLVELHNSCLVAAAIAVVGC